MLRTILAFIFFACVSCGPTIGTVTKDEAAAAGKRLEAIIQNGSSDAMIAFFDMPAMYEIFKKKSPNASLPGVKKEFAKPALLLPYAQQFIEIAKTGSCLLLRNYEKNGRQRLLFRIIYNGEISYIDFQLIKVNNAVKADDVFSYSSGEELTSTFAATADALVDASSKDKGSPRYTDSVKLFKKLSMEGHYNELKEMYERLPQKLQHARGILTIYLDGCKYISTEAYLIALNKAVELYPDSPGSYLFMMTIGSLNKDYDKAFFAINKIDEITGGDPYLDSYRASVCLLMKRTAEAKVYLEKAYTYDPGFVNNTRALLKAYTDDNETDKAKKVVAGYKASKNFSKREMDTFQEEFPQLFH